MDNTLGTPSCAELDYVQMREFQSQVLRQIYNSIQMIAYLPDQAPIIADFFERISKEYAKTNDVKSLLDTLHELILSMKNEKLPTKREEFESRAVLFYILKQLEEFLILKRNFVGTNFYHLESAITVLQPSLLRFFGLHQALSKYGSHVF